MAFRIQEVSEKQLNEQEAYNNQLKIEEQLLKNYITINLPKLIEIYLFYAKLTNPETKTNPILVRLFLWQLLRDIQLYYRLSLVEADLYFENNPSSCTESNHNPFEEIYFWQFLQYLVGCSWLFFKKTEDHSDVPKQGIATHIFKKFFEKEVFPNYGKVDGKSHINLSIVVKKSSLFFCSFTYFFKQLKPD